MTKRLSRTERLVHYLAYVAVRCVVCLLRAMPISACQSVSVLAGWAAADVLRLRQGVVMENLRHALPQLSNTARRRLARRMWEHLFLLVAEIAHVPYKVHRTNWRRYVSLKNPRGLCRLLVQRRAVVLISGHFGNFEMSGYMLGLFGFPTYTVVRPLDNPYIDRFLRRFRGATGQHMLAKRGSYNEIDRLLAAGGTLALLADQYAGRKGYWVSFFNRQASTHKAIALFSLGHGAPLIVGGTRRTRRPMSYEMEIVGITDPATQDPQTQDLHGLTQWFSAKLEAYIRTAPEQYWWVHRRWKRPAKRQSRRRAA